MKIRFCGKYFLELVVFLALNIIFIHASHASILIYDNRSNFEQNLSNFNVIDFTGVGYYVQGYKSGKATFNASGGLYGWEGIAVVAGNSGTITISLEPGIKALGFDIGFHYDKLGAYLQYKLTGASGVIAENALFDPNMIIKNTGSFYGFVSTDQDILELNLYAGIPYVPVFPILDNVTYGNPIPEPTTILLLGSGLIGLAGLKRKFRK